MVLGVCLNKVQFELQIIMEHRIKGILGGIASQIILHLTAGNSLKYFYHHSLSLSWGLSGEVSLGSSLRNNIDFSTPTPFTFHNFFFEVDKIILVLELNEQKLKLFNRFD